jgi:hypothetical protein
VVEEWLPESAPNVTGEAAAPEGQTRPADTVVAAAGAD